ncbi:MAG TPA: hypothetical protein VNT23_03055 [Gaiellaceae bacterium]|nr:hypothetical protein [Gaiellaceae bacterium]
MSVTTPDDLACALREVRATLGGGDATRFPQPRMADLLGVSLRQYQRWETGASQPPTRERERILDMLARAELVEREPAPSPVHAELVALRRQVERLRSELDTLRSQLR